MTKRATISFVLGIAFLLVSIYGLMGVVQAASLFVGARALLNANLWGSVFLIGLAASMACFVNAFRTKKPVASWLCPTAGLALVVFADWFVFPVIHDLLAIDSCLDRGGSFNHVLSECDFSTNHPSVSTFSRQGFRLTAFVIFFLLGLKFLIPYLRDWFSGGKH